MLTLRSVLVEPHVGQARASSMAAIERRSSYSGVPHASSRQRYS